ncbi:MAG: ABC transporter ATP-binding protein [Eubacteriales bacterium]
MTGGYFPMGFGHRNSKYEKVAPPKSLGDVPRYLKEVFGGFFYRLFYIFGIVWKTGPWILFAMTIIALLEGIMPVVGSLITKNILNQLQADFEAAIAGGAQRAVTLADFLGSAIFYLLIFFFIYRILNRLISQVSHAVTRIAGEKVVRRVKVDIMQKAKTLDLASFDNPEFYEKLENANREAGNRPIAILNSTFTVLSTIISLVSYIIILAAAPDLWWTAILIALFSVPSAIISFIYRKKNFQYMRHRSKDRRQMTYYSGILVNKDMVKEIRMFSLADTFIGKFEDVFGRYYSGLRQLIMQESIWHVCIAVLSAVINCFCYATIAYGVFRGDFKIGDYSLYTSALTSITQNVSTLITISATIYEGTLFIDNLITFMKEKQTVIPIKKLPEKVRRGTPHTIEFKNVSFAYPGTSRYVLKNINLTFGPGETVVLVGLNGAGKTTLIKLLMRLYDPTEGVILLDGRDIREYDTKDLYSIFGIIFQDFGKYAVTVAENIHFGEIDKEFDPAGVRRAAQQSGADEYIAKLSREYETPLMRIFEQEGIELSIGQWQKLAIARAFYSDSDILILDEPTASLDPIAEQEIFNQFDRLRRDKTTIFVSHRLSSATVASKIVVLENGEVIEEGNHRELMARHGRYFELFTTQAKRYLGQDKSGEPGSRISTGEHAPDHLDFENHLHEADFGMPDILT